MKIKLQEVVNSIESLKTLSGLKIPVLESFKISLFLKNVSPSVESYEIERNKLVKELGTPVLDDKKKETGNFNFEPDNAKKFNDKMKAILDVDVDVKIPEIKVSALGDIKIEPMTLTNLMWLLKE